MKVIMIAFREGGENGGPYNSHKRIVQSELSNEYKFVPLIVPKGKMGILNFKLLNNLIKQIKKVKPDAVQVVGLEMVGFYLVLACKIAKVKNVILAIHGSTSEAISINPVKKKIMNYLEIFTLKNVTCTYGVSEYIYELPNVKKYSKNYYGCIYNMGFEKVTQSRKDIRKKFEIDENALVIMSTGRITKEKGYDIICQLILNYDFSNHVYFIIVGDGSYLNVMKNELKHNIKEGNVLLLGYKNNVFDILPAGDIFLMASYHETLCMSLVEAGQCGLAMIASNVGGMREVVADGENGYLVDAGNVEEFKSKLKDITNDYKKLDKFKKNAKKITDEKFSNKIITSKLSDMYHRELADE